MNNSKIISIKTTSAVFLAIVLLTGTIALSAPSFMTGSASAQSEPPYYDTDVYTGYAMDMTNGYVDDYKPQSTYSNDNNYKSKYSDFIKKIKCKNNNINVNGENTGDINLGNDGQRAAAGEGYLSAGSFGSGYGNEGYNKKVFDCITNNNDNIVQGGTGTQGPQGQQGPSGITQLINGTNVYLVTNSTTAPGGQSLEVTALCESGDFVLNGGYTYSGSLAGPNMFVAVNEPLTNPPGGGWRTGVFATGGGIENSLTVHAYCFDNSP